MLTAKKGLWTSLLVGGLVAFGRASIDSSQLPARDAPVQADSRAGGSIIRGRVFSTEGRPIRRVQVRVTSPRVDSKLSTSTDADGNYELVGLRAGKYSLSFGRSGFLQLRFGQRFPGEAGQQIDLGDNQVISGMNMILPRAGVISGRITDELGDPLPGSSATALQVRYFRGQRRVVPAGSPAKSDDTGAYRIVGLLPGDYFVVGSSNEQWSTGHGEQRQVFGYAPTYFPGAAGLASAQRVKLGLGQEANSVDFGLVMGRAASLSGLALSAGSVPMAGASISLMYILSGPGGGMFTNIAAATAGPDGGWRLRDVPPGDYLLRSQGTVGDAREEAVQRVVVDGENVEGILLVAGRGGAISGTVTVAKSSMQKIDLSQIKVQTRSLELRLTVPSADSGSVSNDGRFTTDAVVGAQRLYVTGLPEGWIANRIERNGEDLADRDLIMSSGEVVDSVRIELTDRVTVVSGSVVGNDKKPTPLGTVVVFSQNSELWGEYSRQVAATRPTQDGNFEIKGLPTGKYFAVAVDIMNEDDWRDPEVLTTLKERATAIELKDLAPVRVHLALKQ